MTERLNLVAGRSSQGHPVMEEVTVEPRGSDRYLLLASPGLVLGVAAGDVVQIGAGGTFRIVERGQNVCIQIFAQDIVDAIVLDVQAAFAPLNGRIDGRSNRELVLTVPVEVGFPAIERALNGVVSRHPEAEWYYGNVYDPADGVTPLNWWQRG